jgi:DNA polymerase elongation subunit (family B)
VRIHPCRARLPVTLRRAERYDLFLRLEIELLQVVVNDPARFPLIVQTVTRAKPSLTYYNCDVPLAQIYFYERHLVKIRGIEVRRWDTPPFIRRAQEEMIHRLATAANRAEFRERARDVLKLTLDYLELLRAGQIPFDQLVITQHLSRDPTDSAHARNTLNAIVAKELPPPQYALPLFTSHSSPLAKGRQRKVKMQVPSTTSRELSECVR